jgi:WYL_2, Sm-like SH3 beta-barrel fold
MIPGDRNNVIKILSENDSTLITFYKLDGTIRDMHATLKSDVISLYYKDSDNSTNRVYPENQIRVFDLDKKEWRSFVLENLITIGD